ncbi:MAG: glycosyltransferase family 2 protein [Candidatus Sericytochromatia bacterium]
MDVANLSLWATAAILGAQGLAMAWEYRSGWLAVPLLQRHARRLKSLRHLSDLDEASLPPLTLLLVLQNRAPDAVEMVRNLSTLRYPQLELLIVNDGSNDGTFEQLLEHLGIKPVPRFPVAELGARPVRGVYQSEDQPQIWIVDKEPGGVPDALNAGLNFCQTPLVAILDADLEPDPNALLQVIRPFLESTQTWAATGRVQTRWQSNTLPGRPARLQTLWAQRQQLLQAVSISQQGRYWQLQPGLTVFKRASLVDAGGFPTQSSLYLTEAVLRLHQLARLQGDKMRLSWVPDTVGWQAAPPNYAAFEEWLSRDVMAARRCWQARQIPGQQRPLGRHVLLPLLLLLAWLSVLPILVFKPLLLPIWALSVLLAPAAIWQQSLLLGELAPHRPSRPLLGRLLRDAWAMPLLLPWLAWIQLRAWRQPVPPPFVPAARSQSSPLRAATQRLDGGALL